MSATLLPLAIVGTAVQAVLPRPRECARKVGPVLLPTEQLPGLGFEFAYDGKVTFGILPGYLIPSSTEGPPPVVIFYNGLDVTKELLYGIIGYQFSRRGIACLIIDTPGTGEPLRLRGVPSRPEYEVPTAAIVDYLQTRLDFDPDRMGSQQEFAVARMSA